MDIDEIDDLDADLMEDDQPSDEPEQDYQDDNSADDEYYDSDDDESYEEQDDNVVHALLRSKGIDPDSVKFDTPDGPESVPFDNLSPDEQLQILQSNEIDDDYGLTNDEIAIVNQMRRNGWSAQDYNNYVAKAAINNYAAHNVQQPYSVDDFSDDELYIMDLQSKVPDITEDEAAQELVNAKENEDVYNKRVQALRQEYKDNEDQINQAMARQVQAQQQAAMQQYSNGIIAAINNNRTIDLGDASIEMSNQDANDVYNFLTKTDQAGNSYIQRAVSDPNTLTQMAWYLLKGREAFGEMSKYYK